MAKPVSQTVLRCGATRSVTASLDESEKRGGDIVKARSLQAIPFVQSGAPAEDRLYDEVCIHSAKRSVLNPFA